MKEKRDAKGVMLFKLPIHGKKHRKWGRNINLSKRILLRYQRMPCPLFPSPSLPGAPCVGEGPGIPPCIALFPASRTHSPVPCSQETTSSNTSRTPLTCKTNLLGLRGGWSELTFPVQSCQELNS